MPPPPDEPLLQPQPDEPTPPPKRRKPDFVTHLATLGPIGYLPAPGTWGSAVGVFLAMGLMLLPWYYGIPILVVLTALSPPICARGARYFSRKDPGSVIYDELVAVPWCFVPLPFLDPAGVGWGFLLLGFALFRFFDIAKLPPVGTVERWPGGLGVAADDIVAAIMTMIVLVVVTVLARAPEAMPPTP